MSKGRVLVGSLVALLLALPAGSVGPLAPATLLKDIRTAADFTPSFEPQQLTVIGSSAFFTSSLGDGLWVTDGTAAGTTLLKHLSMVNNLRKVGGVLYFHADDGVHGTEFWKSDGTSAGTSLVIDLQPGPTGAQISPAIDFNGVMHFVAGTKLWTSDGTAAGTTVVKDFVALGTADIAASLGPNYVVAGSLLYFGVRDGQAVVHLFRTDGTEAGTLQVSAAGVDAAYPAFAAGSQLYFGGTESNVPGLYVTDGTAAGTLRVSTAVRPNLTADGCHRYDAGSGTLYFSGISSTLGTGLWKSDGTDAGTLLVKDFNPSSSDYYFYAPEECRYLADRLYFRVAETTYGSELWVSDGTTAGTTLVKDINTTSPYYATPVGLAELGGKLYFTAFDGSAYALWETDGTANGTVAIAALADLSRLVTLGNVLLFSNAEAEHGRELWKSDGTAGGTALLIDLRFLAGSGPGRAAYANGLAFFAADDGVAGTELWKTDGTTAGTLLVKDIATGAAGSSPAELTVLGNAVYFSATDAAGDRELWKSDGSAAGTVRVRDIATGTASSDPRRLTVAGATLYLVADDGVNGAELWKSNGTEVGTVLVKDIEPGSAGSMPPSEPGHFFAVGSTLVFSVSASQGLWRSDGTAAGTQQLDGLALSQGIGGGPNGVVSNGYLYYASADVNYGVELFRTDGNTRALVKDLYVYGISSHSFPGNFVAAGDTVYFTAYTDLDPPNAYQGHELWKTDGTAAGTVLVKDINPGQDSAGFALPVALGNRIYFTAFDGTHDTKALWTSDGTPSGTVLLKDVPVTEIAAIPLPGRLLFSAFTPDVGQELWETDGTPAGTVLLQDLRVGVGSSAPAGISVAGPLVLLAADDGASGREPWTFDLGAQTVTGPMGLVTATPDRGAVENLAAVATPAAASAAYTYPYGFYAFDVTGVAAGATVHVHLDFPGGAAPTAYVKCNAGSCAPFAGAAISGQTVTLTLVDGGAGDADGVANGSISDPGAPAVAATVAGGGGGGGDAGGGGGGGAPGLPLLTALLAAAFVRVRRHGSPALA